jgi:hypothetical protein
VRITLEVASPRGENRVRGIAMSTTDGLTRVMDVEDTGAPISVPVGRETLGRLSDVLGEPVAGPPEMVGQQVAGRAEQEGARLVQLRRFAGPQHAQEGLLREVGGGFGRGQAALEIPLQIFPATALLGFARYRDRSKLLLDGPRTEDVVRFLVERAQASPDHARILASLGAELIPAKPTLARMIVAAVIWHILVLVFAQTTTLEYGIAMLILCGFAQSLTMVCHTVMLLSASDPRYRGRIMGGRVLAIYSLPLGLLIAGVLINLVGFRATASLYAVVGLAFTVLIAIRWRASLWGQRTLAGAA